MTAAQTLLDPIESTTPTAPSEITVTVFSKNQCPDCKALKTQLNLRGVPYREINVQEDEAPREEFDGLTPFEHVVANYGRQMPTVVVEDGEWGDSWSGSRMDKVVETITRFREAGLLIPEDQRKKV
ncbi:MAG: glutaredoxin family protein [Mycetocola sp.]